MKKLILLSIMLLSVLFVNAQKNAETVAQNKVDRLTKKLNLTDAQQGQVYDLLLNQFNDRKANGKVNYSEMTKEEKEALKAERKSAKADFNNRMAEILTDEQLAKYNTAGKKNKKARGKGKADQPAKANRTNRSEKGNKANRPANGKKAKKSHDERVRSKVDKMTTELDLDARQQEQVFDLLSSRTPKVKGQDKKELSKADRKAMKAERKQAKADFNQAMSEILTPAQYEQFKSAEKSKKKKGKKAKKEKKQ